MKHVFVAGATGYLGRHICSQYKRQGWQVTALVRNAEHARGLCADHIVEAQATWPEALEGLMTGMDLVASSLGITRQADGVGYWDVDYQANANLLAEALRAGVPRFAYIHVLHADRMSSVPMVAAKSAFVRKLQAAPIRATVIAPTGYFSDMVEFLDMARKGRVWLFGDGSQRINPIHGADLAEAVHDAIAANATWCNIGGPETFTQTELAHLAFATLNRPARITYLPDWLRRAAIWIVPKIAPRSIAGPVHFFLTASGMNMVGDPHGTRHLADAFRTCEDTSP